MPEFFGDNNTYISTWNGTEGCVFLLAQPPPILPKGNSTVGHRTLSPMEKLIPKTSQTGNFIFKKTPSIWCLGALLLLLASREDEWTIISWLVDAVKIFQKSTKNWVGLSDWVGKTTRRFEDSSFEMVGEHKKNSGVSIGTSLKAWISWTYYWHSIWTVACELEGFFSQALSYVCCCSAIKWHVFP